MNDSVEYDTLEGVAIIGMSGRFPGAANVDDLWRNLCDGVESITFFTDDELDQSVDPVLKNRSNYIKARGILEDADKFDAAFFGMSPREAQIMDPQQRIFLEVAWQALESAGYNPDSYDGLIAVYGGTGLNTYFTNNILSNQTLVEAFGEHQTSLVNAPDYLTTRVSYKFNLRGPSVNVYTGCSLSLVAVCLGFDSLMSYQCDMALAGGVFIHCPQNSGYLYQEGGILSGDGHCRPFDSRAQGTVFANGAGIVVLKRLEDALEDGDYIYGVIRGVAVNNDGSKKMSFTAPSVDGQAEVIAMAYANAGIHPETISYIEAHGTGTPVGDPIEIAALTQAFRVQTSKKNYCSVGSLKSNIGHLDAAAGVAGLIKTSLMLNHKMIPQTLHFKEANPKIEFADSPFYVNTELSKWEANGIPRRAGVSSLGVGGTNAHVVLEETAAREDSSPSRPWQLLLLSAKTNTALDAATIKFVNHLKQHPDLKLADIAYTLQVGRRVFKHGRLAVCQDLQDTVTSLESMDPKQVITASQEIINRDVVFMFSGQGSQYVNMGLGLYRTESRFQEQIDRCSEILKPILSLDLRDILYPDENNVEEAAQKLKQTFITQPALFVIEFALAKLWMAWGVLPGAFVGHSIGEYVAACLAGVLSLEDALALVATRGRLMQGLPGGSMLAVSLPEKEIQPFLSNGSSLAVINGPSLCVVSGEKEVIEDLERQFFEKDVNCRLLHTSHAFHSKMMEPILAHFTEEVKRVSLNPPHTPFLSNVTGTWITSDEAMSPEYWAQHLRQTVRFSDCMQELMKEQNRVFLEVGPGHTLSTLSRQHPDKKKEQMVLSSIRHPKMTYSDVAFILKSLGQLWLSGVQLDWSGVYEKERRHRLPLPTYSFERTRCWVEPSKQVSALSEMANQDEEGGKTSVSAPTNLEQKIDVAAGGANGNNIEQSLANIWKELLGVEQVSIHDNFFDLGGSSMIATSMFAQIEKVFGNKLPLATLYKAPTVKQLAGIIQDDEWKASWSSLVEIQTGGSRPPLFLVHGAGGNILLYRDLAHRLGPDQPVYGLQSKGLDGQEPFYTKIEEMAAHYLKEVQAIKPSGPFLLGGYCMGGTVAFEMAQQLHAQGQEAALLALFETYDFSNIPTQSALDHVYYYLQKIEFHWRNFLLLKSKEKKIFFKEKVKVLKGRGKVWFGTLTSKIDNISNKANGQASTLSKLWQINDQASLDYIPKGYKGRITQFIPIKEYAHHLGPELGWERIAPGRLEIQQLPVFPAGMLVEPFVELLAEKVTGSIDKALKDV